MSNSPFKNLASSIKHSEWIFVFLIVLLVIGITTAPVIYAVLTTPANLHFLGLHSLAPGDYYVYFSYIGQAQNGNFLFQDIFSHEGSIFIILNSFWLVAGALGKIFSLSVLWSFHLIRVLSIIVLAPVLYLFASHFFSEVKKRKTALIFLFFASGVSGYVAPFFHQYTLNVETGYYHRPLDIWAAESSTFLSALHSGHMVMALALTVLIFLLFILAVENKKYSLSAWAGVLALVLFSFHPFPVPVVLGALVAFWLAACARDKKIRWDIAAHVLVVGFITLPVLAYYLLMMFLDPLTISRAAQNNNLTPAWYLFLLSYGLLVPLSVAAIFSLAKRKMFRSDKMLFILVWLVAQFIIIYLPFNFQRRMVAGLQIPVILLAVFGLYVVFDYYLHQGKLKAAHNALVKIKILPWLLFVLLFCFSNFLIVALNLSLYQQKDPYVYSSQQANQSMVWLEKYTESDAIILAAVDSGYLIGGASLRHVYLGHSVETVDALQKMEFVYWFFQANNEDEKKRRFLLENGITHIYFGSREKALGKINLDDKNYLQMVFSNDEVTIYAVLRDEL